jgi:hypothetical protein
MPTPEATAAVLVSKDEEALGKMTAGVLEVDETGQHGVRLNLHGEVDNAVKDITQGAVHATRRLDDTAILGHVGDQPLDIEGLVAPSNAHARQGVGRRPAIDDGAASGRPGDACLELVQGSLAGLGGDEPDTKELGRGDHEHVGDGGDVHGQVLQEELVSLLLRQVRLNCTEIDEHGKPLKVGDMVERSGGGGRRAVRRRRAPAGSSNFSIRHADWNSD